MIRNLLLFLASLLFSLALAEGAVRAFGAWSTDTAAGRTFYTRSWWPGVPYLMRPGLVETWGLGTVRTGPLGLREARPLPSRFLPSRAGDPQGRDELRVLVVGDSIVEGYGVDQEETFPRRLEAHLDARLRAAGDGRRARVVNAGLAGLNASDEAALLEALLPEVRPDLVVWMLIYNDFDDSLRITETGALDSGASYRLALVPFLWHVWGVRRGHLDLDDARRSMVGRWRRWANQSWREPTRGERLRTWLRAHSHLFGRVATRWPGLFRSRSGVGPAGGPVVELQPRIHLPAGAVPGGGAEEAAGGGVRVETAPLFSALFESPRYRMRFRAAVNRGLRALGRHGVPAVIYGFDLPGWRQMAASVEQGAALRGREKLSPFELRDGSALLGTSFATFQGRYALGWDGHPAPEGLDLLARAVDVDLVRAGRVPSAEAPGPAPDRSVYWRAVDAARERFRSRFGPMLELERYQGVHQLVGGLPPPRIFPWLEEANFAVVLRGSGERRFVMEVERLQSLRTELELRFGAVLRTSPTEPGIGAEWTAEALLRGAEDRVKLVLPREIWPDGVHGFFDVEVRCTSDPCPRMRIERLGLEPLSSSNGLLDGLLRAAGDEGWPSPSLTTGQ